MSEVENQLLEMSNYNTGLGKVEISPEVIEVIAGIAAAEVEGISSMRGNFATGVVEKLGKKNHGKGVKVDLTGETVKLDIYCVMRFGVSIPKVAQAVQDNVREALINMTAIDAGEVNIHVVGVQFENTKSDQEIEQEM